MASLKGPRHGGANNKVMAMMDDIKENVKDWADEDCVTEYLTKILDKQAFDNSGLIYGLGHAVYTKSDPRCAIGQLGELEYMFVVVDGRRKDSDGCSTDELGQWMFEQGCVQAYNLDGGNSALMWFGGENYSDKTTKNERTVSDFIYISTAIKPEEE